MDSNDWIKQQWSDAKLGDLRRNSRALKIASNLLKKTSSSLPQQCPNWAHLKATYRFFNEEEVTFNALQQIHRNWVMNQTIEKKQVLFIQDGSEIDYSSRDIELGPIGNHNGHGFCLHSTLAVEVNNHYQNILGMPHQILWERKKYKKSETRTQKRARPNEADVWANSVITIGKAPPNSKWIHVCDRGADIFKFLETCILYQHHALVRMVQNRKLTVDGQTKQLLEVLKKIKPQGVFQLERRTRGSKKAAIYDLQVGWVKAEVHSPKYMGKKARSILGHYIKVWEDKKDGLEWILFTTLPVESFEDAYEKVEWYSMRWMIEEYHKCLKTGCLVEQRNFHTSQALQAIIGMLGIIACRLLELKYMVKNTEQIKAGAVVNQELLNIICRRNEIDSKNLTLKDFWRYVAKLGGFLGRKNDGNPGWQTLWRGWTQLLLMQQAIIDFQKCG